MILGGIPYYLDMLERGVPDDIAEADACRIEHYISATTFRALKDYLKKQK